MAEEDIIGGAQNYYELAKEKLKGDKPLDFIVGAIQKKHCGDTDAIETLVLSAITAHPIINTKLHIALTGDSDKGKTDVAIKTLEAVPETNQYPTCKVSPKALYYEARGYKNDKKGIDIPPYSFRNKIIFLDDITDNDTEILKNIANSSNKPPSFTTLINQIPVRITFDYAPVVWTTRVDLLQDVQNQADRRFYSIEINSNLAEVLKHIAEHECNNEDTEESDELHIARAMMKIIMELGFFVEVPKFDYSVAKTKSGLKFLIAMIKAIAKINYYKNKRDGNTVTASKEDIIEGIRLYKSNRVQQHKLSTKDLKILEYVPKEKPIKEELDDATVCENTVEAIHAKINKKHRMDIEVVRKGLKTLSIKGLITAIPGRYNRQFYYRL